jgi:methylmalonyl-CoA/ethylmalonyl-CoA epimerase
VRGERWQLPDPDQVGYVVADLDRAVAAHEPVFGPFKRMDVALEGPLYLGESTDCELAIAYGRAGSLEIELIQPVSGRSPHADFLAAGCHGIHHLRFRVADFAAELEAGARAGYLPIWRHSMEVADFAYLEHASEKGVLIELLRM